MKESRDRSSKFVVDFGDADLPKEYAQHVNRTIQKAALGALADLDLAPGGDFKFRFPPEIYGIILTLPDGDIRFDPSRF